MAFRHVWGVVLICMAGAMAPALARCPKQGCPPPPQNNVVRAPPQQQQAPNRQPQYGGRQNPYEREQNQQPGEARNPFIQPFWRQRPQQNAQQPRSAPGTITQPNSQPTGLQPWRTRGQNGVTQTPFIPRPVRVDRQTTALGRSDGSGFTVEHKNADGSKTFADWRVAPDGRRTVEAYRLQNDRRAGTETKTYLDGRRIVTGKNFQTVSGPGRLTMTTYADGLRSATLPDGHAVYKESVGNSRNEVVRTIYQRVHRGRAYPLRAPVQETYRVETSGGARLYEYVPPPAADGYFDPFLAVLAEGLTLVAICPECANSDADISRGWFASDREEDPAQLVAEMNISRSMNDEPDQGDEEIGPDDATGDAGPPAELGGAAADPDVSDLQHQVDQLHQQLRTEETRNSSLQNQLNDEETENATLKEQASAPPPPKKTKITVPHEVLKQITKQTQKEIGHLKSQQPLALPDLVASAEAMDFIFTISKKMTVKKVAATVSCPLSKGDMAKFAQVPAESDSLVKMKIVVSKSGSCEKDSVVSVAKADAQEMLNSFSKDVRASIDRVHDQIAARATKSSHG